MARLATMGVAKKTTTPKKGIVGKGAGKMAAAKKSKVTTLGAKKGKAVAGASTKNKSIAAGKKAKKNRTKRNIKRAIGAYALGGAGVLLTKGKKALGRAAKRKEGKAAKATAAAKNATGAKKARLTRKAARKTRKAKRIRGKI